MRIRYDREADALGIELRRRGARTATTVHATDDVYLDLDAAGRLIFIEVLGASWHFPQAMLREHAVHERRPRAAPKREEAAEARRVAAARRALAIAQGDLPPDVALAGRRRPRGAAERGVVPGQQFPRERTARRTPRGRG